MTPDSAYPTYDFLGLNLMPLDVAASAAAVVARAPDAPFAYVSTSNAQHVVWMDRGVIPGLRRAHVKAWLRTNDSRVLRLIGRALFGRGDMPVTCGSDLTVELLNKHLLPDDVISVIGGDDVLAREMKRQFRFAAMHQFQPPMGLLKDPNARAACVDFIVAHPARYVFIACGYPQSELIALETLERGGAVGTGLCIGSSLHFATGLVDRAPVWMQRMTLEWLHRLIINPRRQIRRIFYDSAPMLWIAVKTRLGLRGHAVGAIDGPGPET